MRVEVRSKFGSVWMVLCILADNEMTIKMWKTMTQDQVALSIFHSCLENQTLWVISRYLYSFVFIEIAIVLSNEKTSNISHMV